jgi:maltose alpha-D-glucosyltransferase / alpha-amylase
MGDNYYLGDRNGVRTPMQWSPDRNAGFSEVNPQRLFLPIIIDPEYHYEAINVAVQQRNPSSLFWWVKRAISVRNGYKAFGRGSLEFLSPSNSKVLSFLRKFEDEVILVVVNLSRFSQVVELDLKEFEGYTPVEVFSRNSFPIIKHDFYMLTLNAYDYYWFALEQKQETAGYGVERDIPLIEINEAPVVNYSRLMSQPGFESLLLEFFLRNRWIDQDEEKIQSIKIRDEFSLTEENNYFILLVDVHYIDQTIQYFQLPLTVAEGDLAARIQLLNSNEIIAKINNGRKQVLLINGLNDEGFRVSLYKMLSRRAVKGRSGRILLTPEKRIKTVLLNRVQNTVLRSSGENSSEIIFDDSIVLKLYNKLDEGINPGEEIQKFLTTRTNFNNLRPYGGSVIYSDAGYEFSLGIIKENVHSEDSGWNYFLDAANNYFDKVESREFIKNGTEPLQLFNFQAPSTLPEVIDIIHIEMIKQLGCVTGDLHISLSKGTEDIAFKPEEFSLLYQRALFQSFRSTAKDTFRLINYNLNDFDEPVLGMLKDILQTEEKIIAFIRKLLDHRISSFKIRIHGNLHLSNILFTGKDFLFTNFEGKTSIPPSERRLKRSPLRDIASVINSLYFVVHTALDKFSAGRAVQVENIEYHALQWWICMSNNYLDSYLNAVKEEHFIPAESDEINYLLRIYIIDKLMSEMNSMLRKDPANLHIPAGALNYMTGLNEF